MLTDEGSSASAAVGLVVFEEEDDGDDGDDDDDGMRNFEILYLILRRSGFRSVDSVLFLFLSFSLILFFVAGAIVVVVVVLLQMGLLVRSLVVVMRTDVDEVVELCDGDGYGCGRGTNELVLPVPDGL